MDFLAFARKRFSVRSYSNRSVESEKIEKILKAADIAPTAVNYQPQKIYVLESAKALKKNSKYHKQHLQRSACLSCLLRRGAQLAQQFCKRL